MTVVERDIKKTYKKVNRSLKHTSHKLVTSWGSDFVDLEIVNSKNEVCEAIRIYSDATYRVMHVLFTYIRSNINDCIFAEIED